MTTRIRVQAAVQCDVCRHATFEGLPGLPAWKVRAEARLNGWTAAGPSVGSGRDVCPDCLTRLARKVQQTQAKEA